MKTTAGYDSVDNFLTESVQMGMSPMRTIPNAYDPAGNVLARRYSSGPVIAQTFDPLNRIESVREASTASSRIAGVNRLAITISRHSRT